jgi:DNA-binding NtrC family response regulator
MQIPEQVKTSLMAIGLNGADWHRIRKAFESLPGLPPDIIQYHATLTATADRLFQAAAQIKQKEEQMLSPAVDSEVPETWDAMEEWFIRRAYQRWYGLTGEQLAAKIRISKTTLYRKLKEYGVSLAGSRQNRVTVDEIQSEIERLQSLLAEKTGQAAA